jgi:drug/metabolite transporter (DMT)-like permease
VTAFCSFCFRVCCTNLLPNKAILSGESDAPAAREAVDLRGFRDRIGCTTPFYGHFLRGAIGIAAFGFYATIRLPLTDSTAISFTVPLLMILTAIFLLGEKVRWRRGLGTRRQVYRRIGDGPVGQRGIGRGHHGWALRRLSGGALDDVHQAPVGDGKGPDDPCLFQPVLIDIDRDPGLFRVAPDDRRRAALIALVGASGAVGQFCQVRAFAAGELMAVAPVDYSRLIFAGIIGFLLVC